jgi:CBS domain-containing protein
MQANDIMSPNPACCSEDSTIRDVARMMVEHDCGEIPVVDGERKPIGVITDRDICCRVVAQGMDSNQSLVRDHMTVPAFTVNMQDTVERCCDVMESHMIRRVPVVDAFGKCVGMVSQADLAQKADSYNVSHLVREVSSPSSHAARRVLG